MPDTPAARRWRALVEAHAASGLTTRAFAEKAGVNPRTLTWWRSQLRRADKAPLAAAPVFAEVMVEPPAKPHPTVVLAFDDHRVHVVVHPDTDLALLRRLVSALA